MDNNRTTSKTELAMEDSVVSKSPSKAPIVLAGMFIVATIVLTATTVIFVLQRDEFAAKLDGTTEPPVPPREMCTAKPCFDVAYQYLASMDQSQDPCGNFYDYACGKWSQLNPLPADKNSYNTLQVLGDQVAVQLQALIERGTTPDEPSSYDIVRNDYQACLDTEAIHALGAEPLTGLLASLGGWPVLGPAPAGGNWDPSAFEFEKLWAHLRGKYNVQLLIATNVWVDPSNTAKYKLDAFEPNFVVPTQASEKPQLHRGLKSLIEADDGAKALATKVLLDEEYSEERQAYLQYLVDIAVALGANETLAWHDMTDLIEFESHIASLEMEHSDYDVAFVENTFEEIGRGLIDWTRFYQLMLPASVAPGVTDDEPIINYRPDYIGNLTVWITGQDDRVKANYMIWRVVSQMMPYLGGGFPAILEKYRVATGRNTTSTTPRGKLCSNYMNSQYGLITGRMFVDDHFPGDAKIRTLEMIRNLQTAFKDLVRTSDWLQEEDKGVAYEKVDSMDISIGYPDWIQDDVQLNAAHAGLTTTKDEFVKNRLAQREWQAQSSLSVLRQDVNDENLLWFMFGPAIVNAFYSFYSNGIFFPAGILQPPLYNKDYPWYVNYGAMGLVIGHEITHGFDDTGRQFDQDGNFRVWWSQQSTDNFWERAQCMIDQYSAFLMPENNRYLDGEYTLGENIADNGGLRESFKAFQDNIPTQPRLPGIDFTDEQMFFLSYAQVWCSTFTAAGADNSIDYSSHSPGRYRIIGVLQNTEEFSAAFNCSAGSYMNPDVKCKVW